MSLRHGTVLETKVRQWTVWSGSVSHRREYKFTTPSHKDSLRFAVYIRCRANIIKVVALLSRECMGINEPNLTPETKRL